MLGLLSSSLKKGFHRNIKKHRYSSKIYYFNLGNTKGNGFNSTYLKTAQPVLRDRFQQVLLYQKMSITKYVLVTKSFTAVAEYLRPLLLIFRSFVKTS